MGRNLRDSLSRDYQITDNVQTVTYLAKRKDADVTFEVNHAEPRDYTLADEIASQGLFSRADKEWTLGCAELPDSIEPQDGDRITDEDGANWLLTGKMITRDPMQVSWIVHTARARGV